MRTVPEGTLSLIVAISAAMAMVGGPWLVVARLKEKGQGFGPNAIKALGLVLFLPTLIMIAVVKESFQSETLAALLGVVAGYVLSHTNSNDT